MFGKGKWIDVSHTTLKVDSTIDRNYFWLARKPLTEIRARRKVARRVAPKEKEHAKDGDGGATMPNDAKPGLLQYSRSKILHSYRSTTHPKGH